MTLAEIAPVTSRSVGEPKRSQSSQTLGVRALAETGAVMLRTRHVSASLVEVAVGEEVVGFLELAGGVWVALCGPVYSWATEVGQNIDPDLAVLALFTGGPRPTASTGLPLGGGPRLFRDRQSRQRVGRAQPAPRE
jgi:hypothetical protein